MKPILILQNCKIETAGTITDYLEERSRPFTVIQTYSNEPVPHPSEFRATINLGCPISATKCADHAFLSSLYDFVVEVVKGNHHYLGICFGGQILAMALGAPVRPNSSKEIGTFAVRLTDDGLRDPLFSGFEPEFPVFQWHGDTFDIPSDAVALAEGDLCRNQAFRSGNLIGFQFHLETSADEVPVWCEAYDFELDEVNATAIQVISEFRERSSRIRALNYLLLDNFLKRV